MTLSGIAATAKLWMRPGRSERPHIFITGCPRSGTTLVKTILLAHPEIGGGDYESTGIFKPRDLMAYACGEVDLSNMNHLVKASPTLLAFYDAVADRLLEYHGGEVFTDKVWPGLRRLRIVPRLVPHARWIHVIRDGRDCYCSARHHPNVKQARNLERFARYWVRCIQEGNSLPGDSVHTVRYEALAEDPARAVTSLMSFLGMQDAPAQLDALTRRKASTMAKRDVHSRLGEPITTRTVGRWEHELTDAEQHRFLKIAGGMLADLGYA